MRRPIHLLLLVLSILLAGAVRAAPVQSPDEVVKAFYTWYLANEGSRNQTNLFSKWVDPHLLAELALAEERTLDDKFRMEFDPFLCSQIGDSTSFQVKKQTTRGDTSVASVAMIGGRDGRGAPLQVTLRLRDGRWRVSDIVREGSPNSGVLATLEQVNGPFRPGAAPQGVGALAYSPDGSQLAVGTENGRVLLLKEGTPLRRFDLRRPARISEIGFLPDGNLWLRDSLFVRTLDLTTGTTRDMAIASMTPPVVSADGRWAATLGSEPGKKETDARGVLLLDLAAGRTVAWLPFGSSLKLATLALSDDGHWLAAGQEGSIVIWDVERRERATRMPGGEISFLRFLPDGNLLSLDRAGGLVEWEIPSGKQRYIGSGNLNPRIWDVSADGSRVLMTDFEGPTKLWQDRTGENPQVEIAGTALRFLPDGRILVQRDQEYVVWAPTAEVILAGGGLPMAARPDGKVIAWPNPDPKVPDGSDLVEIVTLP